MITIHQPRKTTTANGRVRLTAAIDVAGQTHDLWTEVPAAYGDYLCTERADAFVAALLFVAVKTGEDITFETPMTDELKDGVEHDFIDVICQHEPSLHHVRLFGPTAPCLPKSRTVLGTGASCGVDCLYTIQRRIDGKADERYLVIQNVHGYVNDDSNEKRAYRKNHLHAIAKSLADDLKIPLIDCDTNFDTSGIPHLAFEGCTTYGNLFTVLALQKLFTRYYIASDGAITVFEDYLRNGYYGDCAKNDLLTCPAFSTSSLRFIPEGFDGRLAKVASLCNYEIAWRHLDVCHVHPVVHTGGGYTNCTNGCPKCCRTILEIMAQGGNALEKFRGCFDVDYVKSHMFVYAAELLRTRLIRNEFGLETWPHRAAIGFTVGDWCRGGWIVFKKIVKKILRGGTTSHRFVEK